MRRVVAAAGLALAPAGGHSAAAREEAGAGCYNPAAVGPLLTISDRSRRLVATVAPARGGELVGLSYRRASGESVPLLYRDRDFCPTAGWDGKAPVLWPATGRNFIAQAPGGMGWKWHGTVYPLEIHGFARDLPWRIIKSGAVQGSRVDLELTDSAYTRARFRFGFVFRLSYRISGSRLLLVHRITADKGNAGAMPFSIGNHITFRQPLTGAGPLRLTAQARSHVVLDERGRPTGAIEPIAGFASYPVDRFGREQAYSLSRFVGAPRVRLEDHSGISVTLVHRASAPIDGVPVLFNLWGNAEQGFFSAEPWYGRQNSLATDQGLVRLAPGRSFTWTLAIDLAG